MTSSTELEPEIDDLNNDDVQNDEAIGRAFRRSMMVIVVIAMSILAFLIYHRINEPIEQATEVAVTLPQQRQRIEAPIPKLPMVNVTVESGIKFVHQSGRYGEKLLPETMGSGVAVLDYNNDGHQDLFFVNSSYWPWDDRHEQATPCKLYAGNGKFQFTDVSSEAGLDFTLYGMGVAVGDIDNDGDTDLFVSAVGTNRLFRNDDGRFVDITQDAAVGGSEADWGTSCGFFDFDNDSLLDLFVCNYVDWTKEKDLSQEFTLDGQHRAYGPPRAFAGTYSCLYRNQGNGKFTDVSQDAGLQIRSDDTDVPLGKAMGLAPVDVNHDGWMDVIVANDTVRNFLFLNNKDGTFAEVGRLSGIAFDRTTGNARGAMGIDTAAFREDGSLAVGIGNFANEASALYIARAGRNQFIDAAMHTGFGPPTRQGLTFGLCFVDFDLDGRLDVIGVNGHLEEEIAKTQATQQYAQSPQLFWNAGRDARSELVLVDAQCVGDAFCEPIVGRGVAYGDFDEDGDADIVISTSQSPAKLFRNDQSVGNHWLRVTLEGKTTNRDAIGAIVELEIGGRTLSRTVMPTRGYLSQSEKSATFGLGADTNVREVIVRWLGGGEESFPIESVDQSYHFVQGDSALGARD
jgi:hypothetical protein